MSPTRKLVRRYGRRATTLMLFGVCWVGVGLGVWLVPMTRFTHSADAGVLTFMDDPLWGFMWMACGVTAVTTGFLRPRHPTYDEWGFNSLVVPPMVWGAAYVWSFVVALVTSGAAGRYGGIVGFAVFIIAVLAVLLIAGWPEPESEHERGNSA